MGRESSQNEFLRSALIHAREGLPVIPIKPGHKGPPFTKGSFRDASTDPAVINDWWNRTPDCNVGLATGTISGIIALDIDEKLPGGLELPETVTVMSGGGHGRRHLYFRIAEPLANSSFRWGDLKADGGYVLVPPSIHPTTGDRYRYAPGRSLIECSIAPLPPALLALTRDQRKTRYPQICKHRTECGPSKHRPLVGRTKERKENTFSRSKDDWPFNEYFAREDIALEVVRACGGNIERPEKAFHCLFHPEDHESMSLHRMEGNGVHALKEFHLKSSFEDDWVYLPDAYARCIHKVPRLSGPGLRSLWGIRCLFELGFIDIPETEFPSLPEKMPSSAQTLFPWFLYCLACREAYQSGQSEDGVLFTRNFGADWSGLHPSTVRNGLDQLLAGEILELDKRRSSRNRECSWYIFSRLARNLPQQTRRFDHLRMIRSES